MAKHSLCVVLYLHSASRSDRDQYLIARALSPSCICITTHRTCLSTASVCNFTCLAKLRNANTGVYTSASFNAFVAASSFLLSGINFVCWSFHCLLFCGAASCAKLGTKRRITFNRPKKDPCFVMLVGSWFLESAYSVGRAECNFEMPWACYISQIVNGFRQELTFLEF